MLRSRRWPISSKPVSPKVYTALAALCAVAAFVLVKAEAQRSHVGGTSPVVVAARPIEAGAEIEPEDVEVRAVAEVPPAAIASADQVIGKTAGTPFLEGEVVSATRLAAGGGPLAVSIPAGSVGITLRFETVPAGLTSGDQIDVLATFTAARPYTSLVAEDVQVVGVEQGDQGFGDAAARVMLAVDPESARLLAQAAATGVLMPVVRGAQPLAG